MASPNLPTNVDSSNADSSSDSTVKSHQQHHDVLHRMANLFDLDALALAGSGQVVAMDGATGTLKPVNPSASGAAADLTGTPLVVSAASGGSGAYPARPATTRPVTFRGVNQPTTDGSTNGGGGMVLGTDQWLYWSAADTSNVPDASVTSGKLGNGAVTGPKLANGVLGVQTRKVFTAAQGNPIDNPSTAAATFDAAGIGIGEAYLVLPA